ncbi:hypothetical protein IKW73_01255 [Candidatus Saccharibacteria bacterium]|nr:hypothetical protein [Candidatus Saccharibacteria bacterium]
MIKIFYGDDRVRAKNEITKFLGDDYEIFDGPDLTPEDLPSLFFGTSLFATERSILIRDFSTNKVVFEKLPEYLSTPHKVVLFELKLDKRSATYKEIKDKLEIREFALPVDQNFSLVFDIFKTAKHDGKKAVLMLEKIKQDQDPMMFLGLLASQAIKDFAAKQGTKEKRVLDELSHTDILMKTTSSEPWLLIESFLLQVSSL